MKPTNCNYTLIKCWYEKPGHNALYFSYQKNHYTILATSKLMVLSFFLECSFQIRFHSNIVHIRKKI